MSNTAFRGNNLIDALNGNILGQVRPIGTTFNGGVVYDASAYDRTTGMLWGCGHHGTTEAAVDAILNTTRLHAELARS